MSHKHLEQYLTWAKHFQERQSASPSVGSDPAGLPGLSGPPSGGLQVACCGPARGPRSLEWSQEPHALRVVRLGPPSVYAKEVQ